MSSSFESARPGRSRPLVVPRAMLGIYTKRRAGQDQGRTCSLPLCPTLDVMKVSNMTIMAIEPCLLKELFETCFRERMPYIRVRNLSQAAPRHVRMFHNWIQEHQQLEEMQREVGKQLLEAV